MFECLGNQTNQAAISFQHEFDLIEYVICEDLLIDEIQIEDVMLEVFMTIFVFVIEDRVVEAVSDRNLKLNVSTLLSY